MGLSFPKSLALPFPTRLPKVRMPDVGVGLARASGRAWWRLRYTDGRTINEWDCDWLDAPRKGRTALRLYCPDGQVATLDFGKDATDRLFQFKIAVAGVGVGGAGGGRQTLSHVIGLIHGTDGQCICWVWDYGQKRLIQFADNANCMVYEHVGKLSADHLGISPD